ncbi:MAG: hypothetical protein K2W82_10885 [Candidatus Obscuribacterales bacterium]|nr:hypothetical protein [Candidatus Obscuribacterales bacterium]
MAKILYGICGIGNGHTYRQLPILGTLASAPGNRIVIFAYGESFKFYSERFCDAANVTVLKVFVPFYAGNAAGLDFAATAARAQNQENGFAVNAAAMAQADAAIGKPDFVISDYEPVSAQYAYAKGAPIVTIDQQSKYLVGEFPDLLNGVSYADEVERLRMFFPLAERRFACSFFRVTPNKAAQKKDPVTICPPILKESVLKMKRKPDPNAKEILVYISSQQDFVQPIEEVIDICAWAQHNRFHLFLPASIVPPTQDSMTSNLTFYKHGDSRFQELLATCNGLVTTGGHSLLSEAMHLGIPAYVVPLAVYEQQMNAHVIGANGFGVNHPCLDKQKLWQFSRNLPMYAAAIKADKTVLLRGSGERKILGALQSRFFS